MVPVLSQWQFVREVDAGASSAAASLSGTVWPEWAIYCTLGNFLKPVARIILPKFPTFLGNFWKGV